MFRISIVCRCLIWSPSPQALQYILSTQDETAPGKFQIHITEEVILHCLILCNDYKMITGMPHLPFARNLSINRDNTGRFLLYKTQPEVPPPHLLPGEHHPLTFKHCFYEQEQYGKSPPYWYTTAHVDTSVCHTLLTNPNRHACYGWLNQSNLTPSLNMTSRRPFANRTPRIWYFLTLVNRGIWSLIIKRDFLRWIDEHVVHTLSLGTQDLQIGLALSRGIGRVQDQALF